jgi:hypothetical protein
MHVTQPMVPPLPPHKFLQSAASSPANIQNQNQNQNQFPFVNVASGERNNAYKIDCNNAYK